MLKEGRACGGIVKFVDVEGFERVERVVVKVRRVSVWGVRRADLEVWNDRAAVRVAEVERVDRSILEMQRRMRRGVELALDL